MSTISKRSVLLWLAALAALVAIVFGPLVNVFLSQDDFQLIEKSVRDLGREIGGAFSSVPYHFRPLTKNIYFAAAYRAFGLNPAAYHIVSLLLHILNVVLAFLILRRLRVSREVALVAAACFGLNASHFDAVGWASCIQQLLPTALAWASMFMAFKAIEAKSGDASAPRWAGASLAAYTISLFGVEQTFPAPVLVGAAVLLRLTNREVAVTRAAKLLSPQLALMVVYLGVRFLWKGLPERGISYYRYSENVAENLFVYAGAFFDWWPQLSTVITLNPFAPKIAHFALFGLLGYALISRRWRAALYAAGGILAFLSPTVFQVKHYAYYHTYIAAVFAAYLLTFPLQDLLGFVWRSRPLIKHAVIALVLVGLTIPSALTVRHNIARASNVEPDKYAGSFVVRRAVIAQTAYETISAIRDEVAGASTFHLIYYQPGEKVLSSRRMRGGQHYEVVWALAHGSAINVFLDDFDARVVIEPGKPGPGVALLYYDNVGRFRLKPNPGD